MIEELQKYLDQEMNKRNNQGIVAFEGYSPNEMQYILYDTFGEKSPIKLLKLTDPDYQTIPLLNQIKYVADLIDKQGELKLTAKGFLPTKLVADIYGQGFLKEDAIESGIVKLYKETDSNTITLSRILLELSGIVKKRNNKLSFTKNGAQVIKNNPSLLLLVFKTFGAKFNWAYFDGYGENSIGQLGFGFSLILLSKYGKAKHQDTYYADKYFKAFPSLINDSIAPTYKSVEAYLSRCYSLRTFDRFLGYFGLIQIDSAKKWDSEKYITKTAFYDKLIKCMPHSTIK